MKVKLMLNRVNSHVGSVMVVKVINQKRRPGMTLRRKRISCPTRPKKDEGLPSGSDIVGEACTNAEVVAWLMKELRELDRASPLSVIDIEASETAMEYQQPEMVKGCVCESSASCHCAEGATCVDGPFLMVQSNPHWPR